MLITDIVVWSCLCIHCILWYTLAQCLPSFLPTHKGPKCAPGRRWIQKGIHNCQKWGLTLLVPQNPHLNQGAPQDQLFSIQLAIKLFHKAFTWLGSPPCPQQKRWVCDWVKVHWSLHQYRERMTEWYSENMHLCSGWPVSQVCRC